jgi:hypothetical protein
MPKRLADLVGSRRLERPRLLDADSLAKQALANPSDRWFVLVDEKRRPLGAVTRNALTRLTDDAPVKHALAGSSTVVADARTPVGGLLKSPAIRSSYPGAVIVQKGRDVVGVWAEDELLEQAMESTRHTGDWSLPGEISIPLVLRCCRFKDDGKSCTFVKSFKERPTDLFECPNPERLSAHSFTW